MAKHTVTLIPGDGIGLETTAAMQRVVKAAGADIEWEIAEAGAHMMDACGTPLPESTIEAVRRNKVAIKGPITTPVGTGFRSVNVALRKSLNLNVCLRPVMSMVQAGAILMLILLSFVKTPKTFMRVSSLKKEAREQKISLPFVRNKMRVLSVLIQVFLLNRSP